MKRTKGSRALTAEEGKPKIKEGAGEKRRADEKIYISRSNEHSEDLEKTKSTNRLRESEQVSF